MADTVIGTAVYLVPGQSIKIKSPVNPKNKQGFFAASSLPNNFVLSNTQGKFTRGFIVEDDNVGSILPTDSQEAAVIYTHKKPYENAIWFFAATRERGLVKVISVPIHDHSTIIHGGPAYGTYFNDDIER